MSLFNLYIFYLFLCYLSGSSDSVAGWHMLRRFCSYGLEFNNSDGYTHDWFSPIPALEIAYNSSKQYSSREIPHILERGCIPRMPKNYINSKLPHFHPTSLDFKRMLDIIHEHAKKWVQEATGYKKRRWDKIHEEPSFKRGDQVLFSTVKLIT